MFYDLNIRVPQGPNAESLLEDILQQVVEYEYGAVAITTEIEDVSFEKSKKGKEKQKKSNLDDESEKEIIPKPYNVQKLAEKFKKLKIYSRINILVSDTNELRKALQSKNIKKYHLVACQPENQNVLKALSGINNVNIISYNPESRCTLTFNRKLYNQFVNQNVYFEIAYSPAILDTTARRNLLSLSHVYHAVGKSKNIIVTSGATKSSHIRGPYDVINFSLLFGLSEEQAKTAVSRNCEKLILAARQQRRGKSAVEMLGIKPLKKSEEMETEVTAE